MSQILIVTDTIDAHADRLISLLGRRKAQSLVRLNSSDVPRNVSLSCVLETGRWAATIRVRTNDRVIDLGDLRSVWWRKPFAVGLPVDLRGQEREFALVETQHAMSGLWSIVDCYWVSHPEDIRRASYKLEQLRRAARLGFDVPRTIVTTNPLEAAEFYDDCNGRVVYKVLSDPYLGIHSLAAQGWVGPLQAKYTGTTRVTSKELLLLDSVRFAPCQFQEYLERRAEFRVTLIGGEAFVAEIHPVDSERPGDSGRSGHTLYRKATLPEEVERRCIGLARSYGLNYAAIDLLETNEGQLIFLEINPNGQFLFVQEHVPELPLDQAMAACLLRGGDA